MWHHLDGNEITPPTTGQRLNKKSFDQAYIRTEKNEE